MIRLRAAPRLVMLLLAIVLALASCVTAPKVETPDGFAAYTDAEHPQALSPEGVAFSVRSVANEPEQDLGFWADAMERHMVESGYLQYHADSFTAPAGPGRSFEWIAPVNDEDWIYLTAIVVSGEQILIAEAAGPFELYEHHRAALQRALETMALEE